MMNIQHPVKILRDTGGSQSLILSDVLPLNEQSSCNASTLVQGVEMGYVPAPLHRVYVKSDLVSGFFTVAARPSFPIKGAQFIMGNDIAGGKVHPAPEVVETPEPTFHEDALSQTFPSVFPACVLTRAQSRRKAEEIELADSMFAKTFAGEEPMNLRGKEVESKGRLEVTHMIPDTFFVNLPVKREALIAAQKADSSLTKCWSSISNAGAGGNCSTYYLEDGVLMRQWTSHTSKLVKPEHSCTETSYDWNNVYQIVVPSDYRPHVLSLAHDHPFSGHLGVTKTYNKVLKHFFWPGLKADVVKFCRTCNTCQITGKPNQVVPPAPLCPIPVLGEPFEHVIVDCVGPLPKTKSGNQFLLTVMCTSTRFPEAIPLRRITAPLVIKALTKFFTTFGMPKRVQTDQGTNFLSKLLNRFCKHLG